MIRNAYPVSIESFLASPCRFLCDRVFLVYIGKCDCALGIGISSKKEVRVIYFCFLLTLSSCF